MFIAPRLAPANRDPQPRAVRNRDWGLNLAFGTNFLQMHHEMVKAAGNKFKFQMHHQSLVSWYAAQTYDLPAEWNLLSQIPHILAYAPDISVYPREIRSAVKNVDIQQGVTAEMILTRKSSASTLLCRSILLAKRLLPKSPADLAQGSETCRFPTYKLARLPHCFFRITAGTE